MISVHRIRIRLVVFTSISMALMLLAFALVHIVPSPLESEDLQRLAEQVTPIFVGLFAAAIGYALADTMEAFINEHQYKLVNYILVFSFSLYWIGLCILIIVFLYSHSRYAIPDSGMSKPALFGIFTVLTSVFTGLVGLISSKVFLPESKPKSETK